RLTAAALALFIISLAAQNLTLLIARTYYAAGNSRKPLYYGLVDIAVSICAALGLVVLFHASPVLRLFIESLLRVDNIAGSTVLMLALGYALGSIAEAVVGYAFFVRDFHIPQRRVRAVLLQSFGASVIGGGAAYGTLALLGATGPLTTVLSVFATGFIAGIVGIAVTTAFLYLLKSEELLEVVGALHRRLVPGTAPVLEPTDIES
ncbi:MAG TPA: hypothetical protein VHB93_02250, partial [Candidatus Paceibacterota bacterium]|nr:hypothetical protein [Candidatus Paceibacterota bacterium]